MNKNFSATSALFLCAALTSLVGCSSVSILEKTIFPQYGGMEKNCTDPADIPALEDALLNHVWTSNFEEYFECIKMIGGPDTISALRELAFRARSAEVRHHALRFLEGPDTISALRHALRDEDPYVRSEAVRLLVARKAPGIMSILQQAMKDEDSQVRVAAVKALEDLKAISELILLLNHSDEGVRIIAYKYLENELKQPKVAAAFCKLAKDKSFKPPTPLQSLVNKEVNHPCVISVILEAAKHEELEVRTIAVRFLTKKLDHPSVVPALCELVMDEEVEIRQLAVTALANHEGSHPDIIPTFIKYLKRQFMDSRAAEGYVVRYFGFQREKAKAAIPVLQDMFTVGKAYVASGTIMVTLTRIDFPASLEFAERVLREVESADKRRIAAVFLGFGTLPQAELLLKYLELDGDPEVRRGAVRGLENMAFRHDSHDGKETPWPFYEYDRGGPAASLSDKEIEAIRKIAVPALIQAAKQERSTEVRQTSVEALGWFKDRSALPILEKIALGKANSNLRLSAIESLGSLANSVSPALRKAIKDPSISVRRAASSALAHIKGSEAAKLIMEFLKSETDAEELSSIRQQLSNWSRSKDVVPVLQKALPNGDTRVRLTVVRALQTYGLVALPILEERLKVETTPRVRNAINTAIKAIKADQAFRAEKKAKKAEAHPNR